MDSDKIDAWLSQKEKELFERTLAGRRYYLEFGCGGSTELAVLSSCAKLVSVDSDLEWIQRISAKPRIAEAVRDNRLVFEYIDIGPVGNWGMPKDETKIRNWPNYFLAPFVKYPIPYDIILIDGRFRKACAYASFHFMVDEAVLVIHDYQVRYQYSEIERFFNLIDEVDTLAIFRKKEKIVPRHLYTAILTSLFDFR